MNTTFYDGPSFLGNDNCFFPARKKIDVNIILIPFLVTLLQVIHLRPAARTRHFVTVERAVFQSPNEVTYASVHRTIPVVSLKFVSLCVTFALVAWEV